MREATLKIWIFILLFLGKLSIILFLYIKTSVGGLSPTSAVTAGSIIMPLFMAYITVVLDEFFRNPHRNTAKEPEKPVKVRTSVVLATFIIIPLYVISFWIVINMVARDATLAGNFPKIVAAIESVLGVYVGIIIKSLFKSPNNQNEEKNFSNE